MLKIKYRRKSGLGFLQPTTTSGIFINHNYKIQTIQEYFSSVIPAYITKLQVLENIAKSIECNMKIKIVGSGISAHIRIIEGCIAKNILKMLLDENLKIEYKDIIVNNFELLKKYAKNDLRITERKKTGYLKARAKKPTNKR